MQVPNVDEWQERSTALQMTLAHKTEELRVKLVENIIHDCNEAIRQWPKCPIKVSCFSSDPIVRKRVNAIMAKSGWSVRWSGMDAHRPRLRNFYIHLSPKWLWWWQRPTCGEGPG